MEISLPPKPTKVAKASNIKANSSGEPKARANLAKTGAKKVNKTIEIVPPTNEAIAAEIRASSPFPWRARGRP
ncbi:MAG: hypothetical protein QNJ53_13990 [Pleurocapsa sp. MO_192.B19]|nr:hypothetical protein [Pleurocapsa sp. MO_192.B19]